MTNEPTKPLFSVVIPTYNRQASLRHTVETLTQQTYPNFEVVVVIDGGKDQSAAMLAELAPTLPFALRYFEQPNAGPAMARNRGAEMAKGRYILFIDDDIEAKPSLIEQHWQPHSRHHSLVVIGTTPAPPGQIGSAWFHYDDKMLEKKYRKMREGKWRPGPRAFYTGNASLTRADFWRVGGFDTGLRRGEDIELGYRLADAGLTFSLNEEAVGLHLSEARSLPAWLKIPYTYGLVDARMDLLRNRYGLIAGVGQEYHELKPVLRRLIELCLERPKVTKGVLAAGGLVARHAPGKLARAACSAMFNLRYYQGIVDGLGAAEVWRANIALSMLESYRQRRTVGASENLPGISLVVRPRRHSAGLGECLRNLLGSDFPNFEIIIAGVVNHEDIRPFLADRRVHYQHADGHLLPLARYDLIGFVDETYRPGPDWLEAIALTFANRPEVSLVSSPLTRQPDETFVPANEWEHSRYWGAKQLKQLPRYSPGLLMVARRAVFATTGEPGLPVYSQDFALRAHEAGYIHLHHPQLLIPVMPELSPAQSVLAQG